MSCTLGCLALILAAVGPVPPDAKPEITYQFRIVEVRGLQWRTPGQSGLTPVAQRGGIGVWTAAGDFIESLPSEARGFVTTDVVGRAAALAPSHVTTRAGQSFVTRIAWKGADRTPKETVEEVREGIAATVVGRKLDQGVLVQLVIEDTDVRSIHTIPVAAPGSASTRTARADAPLCGTSVQVTSSMRGEHCSESLDGAACEETECGRGACPGASESSQTAWAPARDGDRAPADERLSRAGFKPSAPGTAIELPEIGRASAAGEWLIPEDGVLVIGFGPHTVADADGRAVVREHLAVVSAVAEEGAAAHASTIVPPPPPAPSAEPAPLPSAAPAPAPAPAPALEPTPRTAAATPSLPSRTLPQGVHHDGTPATPPPLPEDEKDAPPVPAADESRSAEPLPSPQSKPGVKQKAKPAAGAEPSLPPLPTAPAEEAKEAPRKVDRKAAKAMFTLPQLTQIRPTSLLPFSFPGAQFMLPLKAIAIKLPFNQKLEFELVGRIVPDPEAVALEPIVAAGR